MLETTHEYMNNPSTGTSSVQRQYIAELLSEVTGIRGQTDLDYTHRPRYDIPSPGLDSNHALLSATGAPVCSASRFYTALTFITCSEEPPLCQSSPRPPDLFI